MIRFALLLLTSLVLSAAAPAAPAVPAAADPVSRATASIVRVVVIAVDGAGRVAGFGHGSGFAVGERRIVTNAHVVEMAARYPGNVVIGVVPSQGSRSYAARLVAVDPRRDLALLEMRQGAVPAATLYTGPLPGGTDVVALGYPGSVDLATAQSAEDYITPQAPTRSEGNFSNAREVNGVQALLHTASIARGNSGGPLLDECGRVIGVNTFITRGQEGDATFAFAIAPAELGGFLDAAGQGFAAATDACAAGGAPATAEERAREARLEAQARAADALTARRTLGGAEAANADAREDRLAIALLLAALGIAALAGAGLMAWKDRMRPATRLAAAGVALLVAGTAVFLTRPPRAIGEPPGPPAASAAGGGAEPGAR
jgi:S1-C subfamily serine protease